MSIKRNATLLLALSFIGNAAATELSLGAAVIYNESAYRGYNKNTHEQANNILKTQPLA